MYNNFLHKLAIIITYNIDADIMYSEAILSLQDDIRSKGVERTHSTALDNKWIILNTKTSKDAATLVIDKLIEQSNATNGAAGIREFGTLFKLFFVNWSF